MKITAIIPARYRSTRFPGKPLAKILGKSMIQHVYENIKKSNIVDRVIVATDDIKIKEEVESFGGECQITSKDHLTGTDRIAEVAKDLQTDIVVNVQGDEPLITADLIETLVDPFYKDEEIAMATLKTKIKDINDIHDPNVVKVITDKKNRAIYFSRSPIPYKRETYDYQYYKHIGIYAYRYSFLFKYIELTESKLEKVESLEQLRAIENGYSIYVNEINHELIGVDTPEDIKKVENKLQRDLI